ncbi:MAG: transposase zinc-binding domain-containing protein [Candidatus Aminicenantes bacterium]
MLYRVLFHYFDQFLAEYESRFEREYGFLRPIIKEVVERYLDCGNPRCGFARVRCPSCGEERLFIFVLTWGVACAIRYLKLKREIRRSQVQIKEPPLFFQKKLYYEEV